MLCDRAPGQSNIITTAMPPNITAIAMLIIHSGPSGSRWGRDVVSGVESATVFNALAGIARVRVSGLMSEVWVRRIRACCEFMMSSIGCVFTVGVAAKPGKR